MKNLKFKGLVIAMFILSLVSCGSDTDKDAQGGSSASVQALEYYGQYINSVKGNPTGVELLGSVYNANQVGSGQLSLRLDSNYTYQTFLKDNFNSNQVVSNQNIIHSGTWRIEGNVLVLNGFARTYDNIYNNSFNTLNTNINTNTNTNTSTNCLQLQITTEINLTGINGTFLNATSGSQMQFCKQ